METPETAALLNLAHISYYSKRLFGFVGVPGFSFEPVSIPILLRDTQNQLNVIFFCSLLADSYFIVSSIDSADDTYIFSV